MRKLLSIFIVFSILISSATYAEVSELDKIISDTAGFVFNTVKTPTISSIGGEWAVLGLYKSSENAPDEYFEKYYENVTGTVKELGGILSSRKYTEYSRVVIALSVIGKNSENVSGYSLLEPICDFDAVMRQGLNGGIWALIALDSGDYGRYEIKKKYIGAILESELENGGWTLLKDGTSADCDITAMALTALSKHTDEEGVKGAIKRGLKCLSDMQNDEGGFSTYGEETAESIAQAVTALSELGIDAEQFAKNGKTPIDALIRYYKKGAGFSHIAGGESNAMATEQALYALVSFKRLKEGKSSVFARDRFADILGNTAETAILELNKKGIIEGMGNGEFAPKKSVTRAEFATMIVKALGISENGEATFYDVAKTDWFYPYVAAAYENGIVFGVSKTEFNPYGEIICEEATAMLERAGKKFGLTANFDKNLLVKTDISEWAQGSYLFCLNTGILDEEKEPKKILLREEIAQMIYNMLKKAGNI